MSGVNFYSGPDPYTWESLGRLISYGEQVFTTVYLDAIKGPLFWNSHRERLLSSCQFIFQEDASFLLELVERNFLDPLLSQKKTGRLRIRIFFTGNSLEVLGTYDCPADLIFTSWDQWRENAGRVPVQIQGEVSRYKHFRDPAIPNFIKMPSYFPYSREGGENLLESIYPSLGFVETYYSNLVLFHKDVFYIPPASAGSYAGIFLQEWRKEYPDQFIERSIGKKEVEECDGLYICNALRGIRHFELSRPHCKESWNLKI